MNKSASEELKEAANAVEVLENLKPLTRMFVLRQFLTAIEAKANQVTPIIKMAKKKKKPTYQKPVIKKKVRKFSAQARANMKAASKKRWDAFKAATQKAK